jgi:hypothetical protein
MKTIPAIGLLVCVFVSGCSIPRAIPNGGPIASYRVISRDKVLVLNVPDGQEQGQPPAPGSGQGMVSALAQVLEAHGIPFSTTDTTSLSLGFDRAQSEGIQYVLKTTITHWEDNATEWSGKGDKVSDP